MDIVTDHTDILILGSGGAGLFAALHAHEQRPDLKITVAVKGLLGKCGCTRMVQGGYNVALNAADSVERHFMDTIRGGYWIPHQELAWKLVATAPARVLELENRLGCFFDRNPDGSLHGKAFAGQTFDRTIHKGDLTGIEIINRLSEQVRDRPIDHLEDHRAVDLLLDRERAAVAGVLLVDLRTGKYRRIRCKAVLMGTGGGPTMYRYHTPSGEKTCDGLAMALRAGLTLRDMEMVQFHPTGLLAGHDTRLTGTVLEEGLRGAGGYLLNGAGERFMHAYDERGERATRDVVSRAMFNEIRGGRISPGGGLYISMGHLGPQNVRTMFKGMVTRCGDVGADLAAGQVEVVPTAHYLMGGVEIAPDCTTAIRGLYCAGEDSGGVHGANRLGGNGVANSTVFGGVAGEVMARYAHGVENMADVDEQQLAESIAACERPFAKKPGNLSDLRRRLQETMWEHAGIVRSAAGLSRAARAVADLTRELHGVGIGHGRREFNLAWHDWLNLDSQLSVSRAIIVAALARENSRGAHFREDFPEPGDMHTTCYTRVSDGVDGLAAKTAKVEFTHVSPGFSLIEEEAE